MELETPSDGLLTKAGNLERGHLGSQSEHIIRFILPARGFSHYNNIRNGNINNVASLLAITSSCVQG